MGIKAAMISEIAKDTYAINEYGMSAMFLLVGSERAMLIDTGCGTLDIKATVKELTDKPYDVVITHSHGDHIGGVPQFDEVYIHKNDVDTLFPINWNMLTGYVDRMGKMGTYNVYDVKPEDVRQSDIQPAVKELFGGQEFDLGGGRIVTVVETPGHTKGQCSFIDHKTRCLFSGDACNINLGLSACSITTALRGLDLLKAAENQFDRNWNGHVGYAGRMNCYSMPESTLDDCIYICETILNGNAVPSERRSPFGNGKMSSVEYGHVLISYNPDRLIDEGEEPVR